MAGPLPVEPFDGGGTVRRIRRRLRMSQRAFAAACGITASVVAKVENGQQRLDVDLLATMAAVAQLRLVVVDDTGREVPPMQADPVVDQAGRRYPAHVDLRHGDEGWWYDAHRDAEARTPRFTFDRRPRGPLRCDDHPAPSPEDDPRWRARERDRRAAQARDERRRAAHERYLRDSAEPGYLPEPEVLDLCRCPPGCLPLLESDDEAAQRDPHVDDCPCRCDIC